MDRSIQTRWERLRLVLWCGTGFFDDDLAYDLHEYRLPVIALLAESLGAELTRAFGESCRSRGVAHVQVANADDAKSWVPSEAVAVDLGAATDSKLPRLERSRMEGAIADIAGALAQEAPVYVGLGLTDPDELSFFVETIKYVDPRAPVLLVGPIDVLESTLRSVCPGGMEAKAFGTWADLTRELEARGYRLEDVKSADGPAITVKDVRVPLGRIFEDSYLRIDGKFRILTSRAVSSPPPTVEINDLFRAFMSSDERRDASSVGEDLKEWWAIGSGLPFTRDATKYIKNYVLDLLHKLSSGSRIDRAVCWLPCEGASGATSLLHVVAHAAAQEGYPTLVLKQHVREIEPEQVEAFLRTLHYHVIDQCPGQAREHPALIVLDAVHAGSHSIEQLADVLQRRRRTRVLLLRAFRVPTDGDADPTGDSAHAYYERLIDDAHVDLAGEDAILPRLRAGISPSELERFPRYAAELRSRKVNVFERDDQSWSELAKREKAAIERLVNSLGFDEDRRKREFTRLTTVELFWVAIYHYLSHPEFPTLTDALAGRLSELLGHIHHQWRVKIGVLTEIAKAYACEVLLPETALLDWFSANRGRLEAAAAMQPEARDLTAASIQSVREYVRSPEARFRSLRTHAIDLFVSLDALQDENWIRIDSIDGVRYARFMHHVVARLFLRSVVARRAEPWLEDIASTIGSSDAIDFPRQYGFAMFSSLLKVLQPSSVNERFCEQLSETVLAGTDNFALWQKGRGDARLEVYESIPEGIRNRSRVMLHHLALVLRRTTLDHDPARRDLYVGRCLRAKQLTEEALKLPWRVTGERDDHPAHIRTTLGWVLIRLAELEPGRAPEWRSEALGVLRDAIVDLPTSRHTRFALAKVLFELASVMSPTADTAPFIASHAAECLSLLSIPPTHRREDWYDLKARATELLGGDDARRALLDDLCQRGVEDGYLLSAELAYYEDNRPARAINILRPVVEGERAISRPRAARRLAALLETVPGNREYEERYRLLASAEGSKARLTPPEEFQLAWLAYQLGRYSEGHQRFVRLRASKRALDVMVTSHEYVRESDGTPRPFRARVEKIEDARGWMSVFGRDGSWLFRAPFDPNPFGLSPGTPPGKQLEVLIRFGALGPWAVPWRTEISERKGRS